MGICVDKPGEHGHCNACDQGWIYDKDGKLLSSDQIHRRLKVMATKVREQGLLHQNTSGQRGLPVNGAIFMSSYWERGMGQTWRPYTGIAHVSHIHYSGWPSITGWI
jgi:hypothetical protein